MSSKRLIIVKPDSVIRSRQNNLKQLQKYTNNPFLFLTTAARPFQFLALLNDQEPEHHLFQMDISMVSKSESKALQFSIGHPEYNTLYAAHPALPSVYYTVASFHRLVFEHKFSEAIRLLMSLGARKITVEHIKGWSKEFSAKIATSLSFGELTANLDHSAKNNRHLLFEAKFDKKHIPFLPDDLIWFSHEPTWQTIATGRLEFGLTEFSLTVSYEDDFGINASLKSRVQKTSLELGGVFDDHVATTWKIYGDFYPTD